ncbi:MULTISPECIES: putative toxin-antitoxin system toxin component, PIN family [unclassified Mesorhizobium]|uniref:PIN domain-containing protein n=1 Tax=unclassified Mesorhizobium TaxID=325217 RepID=UPI002479CBBF|nr:MULTISPECIES: PIN domain-containing protein [unclassified Mesorhizobium]
MRRIVLDTNVLTAGLRSRNGASFAVLQRIADRHIRPLVTTALFLEYETVLTRPEQMAVHGLSNADLDRLLAGFATLAERLNCTFSGARN